MGVTEQGYLCDYVVYLRKSKGKLGIARQRTICLAYLERVRGRLVEEFVDADATAFAEIDEEFAPRPDYERMLEFVRRDDRDPPLRILSVHADRLHRNTGELRPFTALCAQGDHLVETVRSGSYDLSTANGRKRLRDDTSDAEHEVDHLHERVDDQKAEAAAAGKFLGGPRPFGFKKDGVRHRKVEAKALAQAYDDVLAGTSLNAIMKQWNAAGLTTTRGNPWEITELRRLLLRPRNAGLSKYRGQVIGKAVWKPIVKESKWRAVVRILTDPSRRTNLGKEPRWLGTNIYHCGICKQPKIKPRSTGTKGGTQTARGIYRCGPGEHVTRDAVALDDYVSEHIIARLSREDARDLLVDDKREDLAELEEQLLAKRDELAGWRKDAETGEVTRLAFKPVEKRLLREIAEIEGKLVRPDRALILKDLIEAEDVAAAWVDTPLDRRRAVLRELLVVTIHPAPKGRPKNWWPGDPYFHPESIEVLPVA